MARQIDITSSFLRRGGNGDLRPYRIRNDILQPVRLPDIRHTMARQSTAPLPDFSSMKFHERLILLSHSFFQILLGAEF